MSEKMDAWTTLKKELNDKIYEIYGGTPPDDAKMQNGISTVLDFHIDEKGTSLIKIPVEKTYNDFEISEKEVAELKEQYLPHDRFKFDKVMTMISKKPDPEPIEDPEPETKPAEIVEPPKAPEKKHTHHHPEKPPALPPINLVFNMNPDGSISDANGNRLGGPPPAPIVVKAPEPLKQEPPNITVNVPE